MANDSRRRDYQQVFYRNKVAFELAVTRESAFLSFALPDPQKEGSFHWRGKQTFALRPIEAGEILATIRNGGEARFFHDPSMRSQNRTQERKVLRVRRKPESREVEIRLAVGENQFFITLTAGESEVLCILLSEFIKLASQ
ncbi:MAG: hypothetical protein NZ805_00960 [Armatimonadetes bacterium]|nr:hypothetical protein [Armatimonadota bacterium]MDW8027638.1 hypothetical protein [Armatimonadota bacterium]